MKIAALTIVLVAAAVIPAWAQDSSVTPDEKKLSPDKAWEYLDPESDGPKIVKADSHEVAGDLSDACGSGSCGEVTVVWAPDSKRFAFSWGQGREHHTALYALREEKWIALKTPGEEDEIRRRVEKLIEAQKKAKGLSKNTWTRLLWWTVRPDHWIDSSTLVIYASEADLLEKKDLGFGGDFLFTLKFDSTGAWKIVGSHRMSEKENEAYNQTH